MSYLNKNLTNSLSSQYTLMISKLITLLQSHLIELIPLTNHSTNKKNIQKKSQTYQFLLAKMKLLEQQQFISPKYSQLCQPLIKTLDLLDDNLSESSETQTQKSLSMSSKISKQTLLYQSLDKSCHQKSPPLKHSFELKKNHQRRNTTYSQKNAKPDNTMDWIKNPRVKKHMETLRDFQQYQELTETQQIASCVSAVSNQNKRPTEPRPGQGNITEQVFREPKIDDNQEKEPTLPNFKDEIILSKSNFRSQITNRTMTEFSRGRQLQKIDEEGQNDANLQTLAQKQVYSFQIAQTPTGTVYGKQEQVNPNSKFKLAMYRKLIDRTHLKKVHTQFT